MTLNHKVTTQWQITQVYPLEGGVTNRCLRLEDNIGTRYVWRPNDDAVNQFDLCRVREYATLTTASQSGLCPAPLAWYPEGLLLAWVEGEVLDKPQNVPTIIKLAQLQARVHQLPLVNYYLDPFVKGERYYHRLSSRVKTPTLVRFHHRMQQLRFSAKLTPKTAHLDLGYYNVIKQPNNQLALLDWEYAAVTNPCLDLIMTAQANGLILEEWVRIYTEQAKLKNGALWQQECTKWQPIANYLAILWYLLAFELYQEQDCLLLAEQLLARE